MVTPTNHTHSWSLRTTAAFFLCNISHHKQFFREYKENIEIVDDRIRRFVKIIDDFYNHDDKTAFVFTSDHGMTDWGETKPSI